MPRTAMSPAQKKYKARSDNLRGLINGEMCRFGLSNKAVASKALVNEGTFNNKKSSDPMKFTLREIFGIADALHIKIIFQREAGPDEA